MPIGLRTPCSIYSARRVPSRPCLPALSSPGGNFEDALERAQAEHAPEASAQSKTADSLTAIIAREIHAEIRTAAKSAFRVLTASGGEIAHAVFSPLPSTKTPLGRAVLLLRIKGTEWDAEGRGLWALETGDVCFGKWFEKKDRWLTGKPTVKLHQGLPIILIRARSQVWVEQVQANCSVVYPSNEDDIGRSLLVRYETDRQRFSINHDGAYGLIESTPTEYVADLTASRLAEER